MSERRPAPASVTITALDPAHPDAQTCLRAYATELDHRFRSGFDPGTGITAEPHELRPPAGAFLVAHREQEPVGCGAVRHHVGWSEIKRVWVADSVRGLGVGRRLLVALETQVSDAGRTTVRLDTHRSLTEAMTLYRSAGYREVPAFNDNPYAHHWFEKNLA